MGKPAPGRLELVRGFINTLDVESGSDELASPGQLRAWLDAAGLEPGRVTEAGWKNVLSLREALRACALANHGGRLSRDAVAAINAVGADAPLKVVMADDGRVGLEPSGHHGLTAALGRLLTVVHEAQADGSWSRLKACAQDDCQWAFYDSSRNRSGTWCSMEVCGNRNKVRAHRHRTREAGTEAPIASQ